MRKELPALSYHFGIKPWEVQHLTFGEIEEYRNQLKMIAEGGQRKRNG